MPLVDTFLAAEYCTNCASVSAFLAQGACLPSCLVRNVVLLPMTDVFCYEAACSWMIAQGTFACRCWASTTTT